MTPRLLRLTAGLLVLAACSSDKDAGSTALTTLFPDTDPTEAYGEAGATASPTAATAASGDEATDPTAGDTDAQTDSGAQTDPAPQTDSGAQTDSAPQTDSGAQTDPDATAEGGTTEPAPTDGPGVLPGETGLDAFCRRYVECGGTYYADAQACIDESLGYWGECPSRREALDAFGACMSELECDTYDPDAFNPASTPCAQAWSDLNESAPC